MHETRSVNFIEIMIMMMHNAIYDATHGKGLRILIPKQMLQRLPTAIAQVKTGNTSEHLLNEIYQII